MAMTSTMQHSKAALPCRRLSEKIGVDLEGKGTALVDHVDHVDLGSGGHTTVLADGFTSSEAILGGFKSKVRCLFHLRACMHAWPQTGD